MFNARERQAARRNGVQGCNDRHPRERLHHRAENADARALVCYAPRAKVTPQSVEVHCMTDLLTDSPIKSDMGFNFYAGVSPTA